SSATRRLPMADFDFLRNIGSELGDFAYIPTKTQAEVDAEQAARDEETNRRNRAMPGGSPLAASVKALMEGFAGGPRPVAPPPDYTKPEPMTLPTRKPSASLQAALDASKGAAPAPAADPRFDMRGDSKFGFRDAVPEAPPLQGQE